jgi:hypothetical protein
MTQVGSTFSGDGTFFVAIFALLNPPIGTGTYTATWTNSVSAVRSASQFSGVNQTSVAAAIPNISTNSGTSATATATVATTSGDGAFWVGATTSAASWNNTITGGTFLNEKSSSPVDGQFAQGSATTASTTISGGIFSSATWDVMLVDIAQAGGAAQYIPNNFWQQIGPALAQ